MIGRPGDDERFAAGEVEVEAASEASESESEDAAHGE